MQAIQCWKLKTNNEKQGIDRWANPFNKILNCSSKVNEDAFIFQTDWNVELDVAPDVEEIKKAINQISNGKAQGSDSIPVEAYKKVDLCWPADSQLCSKTYEKIIWFFKNWETLVIKVKKREASRHSCDNYRGTTKCRKIPWSLVAQSSSQTSWRARNYSRETLQSSCQSWHCRPDLRRKTSAEEISRAK